jgi:rhomboid family GlyGly-CTERM serine protease
VSAARRLLRVWSLPLLLAALLLALQALGLRDAFEYRRAAVLHGQLWRLLTGNLVHLGWAHLLRDLAGLFLIWGLFAPRMRDRTWLALILACATAVGLGLLAFSPQVAWYVGISGVLFGLFCAGALLEWPQRPLYAGALLLGMAMVIGWTLHAGALPGETRDLGGAVVPQAHLYGALGGAAFILLRQGWLRLRVTRSAGEGR